MKYPPNRLTEFFARLSVSKRGHLSAFCRFVLKRRIAALVALLITGLLPAAVRVARAQDTATLTTVYEADTSESSSNILSLLQGSDGNFYGTTYALQDSNSYGTVFRLTSAGVFTTLYGFTNGSDGGNPVSELVQGSDGNFYGATASGGASGDGTVFQLTQTGVLTTLYSFTDSNDSQSGVVLLQGSDGNFYGTTYRGGVNGYGTVFRLAPTGVFTTLYTFNGSDGSGPGGLVEGIDGNFYGVTHSGGAYADGLFSLGYGTVFQLTSAGVLTSLYNFSGSDGAYPSGTLLQGRNGNFYGVTANGGSGDSDSPPGDGTIFQIRAF